jgi:signal transduction histidine kinase
MEHVAVIWSVGAAAGMVLAVLCGLMWLMDRRELAGLMLFVLGVATAFSAYAELGMMHSATPAEYGAWLRWYHLPIFFALIAQVLFVCFYLETVTKWLMWGAIVARSFVIVVNFSVDPNYHFSSIESLRSVSVLGDRIAAIGAAVPRHGLQSIAVASLVLLLVYVVDAMVRSWQKGGADNRRKVIAIGVAIAFPMLCTFVYTQLLVFGVIRGLISNVPWFLGSLLIMGYVSGRDFVLSRRARLEVAELRAQLAQIERVNLLGQLASSLAHELSQPLTAISFNLASVQKNLKHAPPEIGELESTLADVDSDIRRGIEIISRMRQLFKQRSLEVAPIRIDEVLRVATSLVAAEAKANRIDLRWQVQPGLPLVSGDTVHLLQVLLNLLTNGIHAVQSCPDDARHIVVEVRARERTGEVEVRVQDSGCGITDSVFDRIFEPLFTTKAEGMGMGLALSRSIIEAHGGRLWADNRSRQAGAVFRFTLQPA